MWGGSAAELAISWVSRLTVFLDEVDQFDLGAVAGGEADHQICQVLLVRV